MARRGSAGVLVCAGGAAASFISLTNGSDPPLRPTEGPRRGKIAHKKTARESDEGLVALVKM